MKRGDRKEGIVVGEVLPPRASKKKGKKEKE